MANLLTFLLTCIGWFSNFPIGWFSNFPTFLLTCIIACFHSILDCFSNFSTFLSTCFISFFYSAIDWCTNIWTLMSHRLKSLIQHYAFWLVLAVLCNLGSITIFLTGKKGSEEVLKPKNHPMVSIIYGSVIFVMYLSIGLMVFLWKRLSNWEFAGKVRDQHGYLVKIIPTFVVFAASLLLNQYLKQPDLHDIFSWFLHGVSMLCLSLVIRSNIDFGTSKFILGISVNRSAAVFDSKKWISWIIFSACLFLILLRDIIKQYILKKEEERREEERRDAERMDPSDII